MTARHYLEEFEKAKVLKKAELMASWNTKAATSKVVDDSAFKGMTLGANKDEDDTMSAFEVENNKAKAGASAFNARVSDAEPRYPQQFVDLRLLTLVG
jgi:hypothetical protein